MKQSQLIELIAQANINGVFTPEAVKKIADSMNASPAQVRLLIGRCEIAFTESQKPITIKVSPFTSAKFWRSKINTVKRWNEF